MYSWGKWGICQASFGSGNKWFMGSFSSHRPPINKDLTLFFICGLRPKPLSLFDGIGVQFFLVPMMQEPLVSSLDHTIVGGPIPPLEAFKENLVLCLLSKYLRTGASLMPSVSQILYYELHPVSIGGLCTVVLSVYHDLWN